jgi:hypothetical protein
MERATLTPAQMNRADAINDMIRHQRGLVGLASLHAMAALRPGLERHVRLVDAGYRAPRHCCDAYTIVLDMRDGESVSAFVDRTLAARVA